MNKTKTSKEKEELLSILEGNILLQGPLHFGKFVESILEWHKKHSNERVEYALRRVLREIETEVNEGWIWCNSDFNKYEKWLKQFLAKLKEEK